MCKYFGWASSALIVALCDFTNPVIGQQLLSSFEGNLSTSVGANWGGPGISRTDFVSAGATDGSSALAVHHAPTWDGNNPAPLELNGGLQLAQAVATHDFLLMDVTTTDLGVAGDGWSPAYRIMWPIILTSQGGWHQPGQVDITTVAADDGGSATYNVVFDLTNANMKADAQAYVSSGGGTDGYFRLIFAMIGGDQGTPVKAGDYAPADSIVNAADYVTWRNNLPGGTLTNETVTPGVVDSADYDEWRAHYGTDYLKITTIIDNIRFANAGSGAGSLVSSTAPEPSSAVLTLIGALAIARSRRLRK